MTRTFDEDAKAFYLGRVRDHMEADHFAQATGYFDHETGRGCSLGCTMESEFPHAYMMNQFGVDGRIVRVNECIFEHSSPAYARRWAYRFVQAMPVRANTANVWPRLALWMLSGEIVRLWWHGSPCCETVAGLYERSIAGDIPKLKEWHEAARMAADCGADALYAAAMSGGSPNTTMRDAALCITHMSKDIGLYALGARVSSHDCYELCGEKLLELLEDAGKCG